MKGRRISLPILGRFAEQHHLSVDWLLCGDLKGRFRMARNEFAPQQPDLDLWSEIGGLLRQLGDQKLLPAAVECMRLVLERRGTAS